jgi:hypothetical protein
MIMKKIFTTLSLTLILLLGVRTTSLAQTTLSAGDIAFIGLYTSGSAGVGDAFSFITLKSLSAGTVIYFTDEGWNNDAWGGSPAEVHFTWSPPAAGTPIGTIVTITGGADQSVPGTPSSGTCSSAFLSGTAWHYPTGEEILAYQSSSGARPTSPTFIAGMIVYYNTNIYDATTKWCSTTVGFTEMASTLPSGLTNGVNCVSIVNATYTTSTKNCRYIGSLTGSANVVRALINSDGNWTRSTTTPFDITSAAFSTPSVTASVDAPTVTTQAVSNILATAATGNGNVTATGGQNITERGIYWSLIDGFADGTGTKISTTGDWSTTGAFTQEITGLSSGTTYYVKAFAKNSSGTSYGSQVSFTTKTIPTITWSNPVDITYGTLLSATQLNATANIPGTFTYTPALGAKLNAGSGQTLQVDFTPTDLTNYEVTSKTVFINVFLATALSEVGINKLIISPNPVIDAFIISGIEGRIKIKLRDLNGRVILTKEVSNNEIISLANFSSGIYIVTIEDINGFISKKIVKK